MIRFSPKVGNLVYFTWQDHCSLSGAGWKVKIDKECITTAASWDGFDAYSQFAIRLRRDILKGRVIQRLVNR